MLTLPLVVEPLALQAQLSHPDLLIIDLSSQEHYDQGHLPGAVRLDAARLLRGEGPVPNLIPTEEQLSALCSELGIRSETRVVAYDDQMGPWAGRLVWTLNCIGHSHASVLNGQLPGWLAAGLELETSANSPTPATRQVSFSHPELIMSAQDIVAALEQERLTVWDARSAAEFSGEKVVNALKGGHIPGARHLEWTDLLEPGPVPRLKPVAELKQLLQQAGIRLDQPVVTHCQTHRRSGLTWLVGTWLGMQQLSCYDGSWFEWGNHPELPVEQSTTA